MGTRLGGPCCTISVGRSQTQPPTRRVWSTFIYFFFYFFYFYTNSCEYQRKGCTNSKKLVQSTPIIIIIQTKFLIQDLKEERET